jgi:hypothetical protein
VVAGLCAGNYTCTISDNAGGSIIKTFSITEPPALSATQSQTNITCVAGGMASVTPAGGTGAYTYSWTSTGGTLAGNVATTAGNYTCTIKDVNNCSLVKTFTISSNTTAPTLTISGVSAICNGQSALLTASGANTYSWSTTAATSTISVNPGNTITYSVIGTNTANSCSATAQYTLTVNALPVISVNSGSICSGSTFTLIPSGASTYTLNGSGNNFTVNPLANTSYSVTGTSTAGCVGNNTAISTVSVHASPTIVAASGSICAGQVFTITASGASTYTYSGVSNTVSPATTTSYSVSGTSTLGCNSASPAIVTVTVNPLPVITVNSGTICIGSSFTIVPGGASTYTLSGGAVVTPTSTTVYSVTGTDVLGCVSAGPALSSITVFALPVLTVSSSNPLICAGNSATLTANGANSYLWSTTQNTISIVVSPTTSTSYTVTGTDANNCSSTATITQNVNACTALNELNAAGGSASLYPNPNNGLFNLELQTDSHVQICDITGQIIWQHQLKSGRHQLDLGNAPKGIYFVKLSGTGTSNTLRLIRE